MGLLIQNLVVLVVVALCVRFVFCQVMRSLGGKGKGLSGCAGCSGCSTDSKPKATGTAENKSQGGVVFLPVDNLRASKRLAK